MEYGEHIHPTPTHPAVPTMEYISLKLVFDFTFEYPETTLCSLYTKAMTGIVCNPNQGRFISNNTLRVCSSTCQTLFDNCGLPGVNFPKWTTYTDAISLCKEAWGGFGIFNPCNAYPNGYACQSEILGVEVVVNGVEGVDCLGIVPPTPQEIKEYENNPFAYIEYKCSSSSSSTNAVIIGSVVGGVVLFGGLLCFGLLLWRSKRNRKRMEGEGVVVSMGETDHRQQSVEVVVENQLLAVLNLALLFLFRLRLLPFFHRHPHSQLQLLFVLTLCNIPLHHLSQWMTTRMI